MADKGKKGGKEVFITGFIEEVELEDGEMGLQLDDGDHTYQIVMDKVGSKLRRFIDEEVDASGIMSKMGNKRELKVNTFKLTDDYADDDDSYDDDDGGDDYYDDDEDYFDDRR